MLFTVLKTQQLSSSYKTTRRRRRRWTSSLLTLLLCRRPLSSVMKRLSRRPQNLSFSHCRSFSVGVCVWEREWRERRVSTWCCGSCAREMCSMWPNAPCRTSAFYITQNSHTLPSVVTKRRDVSSNNIPRRWSIILEIISGDRSRNLQAPLGCFQRWSWWWRVRGVCDVIHLEVADAMEI